MSTPKDDNDVVEQKKADRRFPITLHYGKIEVAVKNFDPSQELTQLFEKYFPSLRVVEFQVCIKTDEKNIKIQSKADIKPNSHLIALNDVSDDSTFSADQMECFKAYDEMRGANGVEIKDRKWMFKTYRDCFTGKDAVAWLVTHKYATSVVEALAFGARMQKLLLFEHVTRDHPLKDEGLFYRFRDVKDTTSWSSVVAADEESDATDSLQAGLKLPTEDMLSELGKIDVTPLDEHNIKLLDNVHPANHQDPTPARSYNMVVIGAGAAGLVTALGSAGVGAKVALIERELLGGDCLNVGCVPSKCLLRAAKAVHEARNGGEFGVVIDGAVRCDFGKVMERMRRLRASISPNDSAKRIESLGVDLFLGEAKFVDKSTISVNGQTLKFAKACVATGGRAAVPPIKGLDGVRYLTNGTIFNLTELPARLAVIGAGAIGCEMAQAFARFGSAVTMFARSGRVMSREDADAAELVQAQMAADGVQFQLHFVYDSITQAGANAPIVIRGTENGVETKIEVDQLLVATGRVPNVEGLNLEAAGIKYNKRAGVLVSDTLQTSNSNVYAAGDICTPLKFTHMADNHARIVVKNALFFGSAKASALVVPWATYTEPEVAHVGLYEEDLELKGIKYTTYRRDLDEVDRAITDSQTNGFVKIHCEAGTDTILGATIVAEHAGDMISEITLAMVAKIGLGTFATVIHPYPTQAEAIKQCGDAFNRTRLTTAVRILFRKLLAARR